MGQVRNGSVTTTDAIRGEIQRSQTSLAQLSKEMGISAKTVAKWRMRVTVEDLKTGSKDPRSIVLTEAEEVMIVVFGRYTLDIRLYDLQSSIMHLTRLELHRCLQRHGISLLLDFEGDKLKRQKFNRYPIRLFISTSPRFKLCRASSISLLATTRSASLQSRDAWTMGIARPSSIASTRS